MTPQLHALLRAHLPHEQVGKVRNSFSIPSAVNHFRLPVVSDRVSIFDFQLGFEVPGKGVILNAFNIKAKELRRIHTRKEDDLIAFGVDIDDHLPQELQFNEELAKIGTVIQELDMVKVECVVRAYCTGSLWKEYKAGRREYCGHRLPEGLVEGAKLPKPLFTPTTKAEKGHDLELDHRLVREQCGDELEKTALRDFDLLYEHLLFHDIIGVDTKFEYGYKQTPTGKVLVLADEFWTPDSSRFWQRRDYEIGFPKRLPTPMDKQALREWGKRVGIDTLDPKNPEDIKRVREMHAPQDVLDEYVYQMQKCFHQAWGEPLDAFVKRYLLIQSP